MAFYIILGVLAVILFYVVGIYNKLVKMRNGVRSSWSDIDVQLKKRFNLIPSLVETVKGYAKHESGVFERVTQARSQAMQATTPEEMAKSENMIKDTLKSLFAVVENYPELKANQNFLDLQRQLEAIEQAIEQARRYYNAIVRDFNTMTETFPSVIVASMFNFKAAEFFEIEADEERKPIRPDFSS